MNGRTRLVSRDVMTLVTTYNARRSVAFNGRSGHALTLHHKPTEQESS